MNVWQGSDSMSDLVVAQTAAKGSLEHRSDDKEFAVAWERSLATGDKLVEVDRIQLSCPHVFLVVPPDGPYVYEARSPLTSGSTHPECSCTPSTMDRCPRGLRYHGPSHHLA